MKLVSKLTFLLVFICLFITACTNEDEKPQLPKPIEEQVKQVVAELAKIPEVSQFTEILKTANLSDVDAEALTVFAVKNSGIQAKSTLSTGLTDESLRRHIVKGVYEIADLKNDMVLFSITDDSLLITRKEDVLLINGVSIETQGTKVGKSMIYLVPEIVPLITNVSGLLTTITVYKCNAAWTPQQPAAGFPVENANVNLYTKEGETYKLQKTYKTNKDGKVVVSVSAGKDLYYEVSKGDTTSLHNGFQLNGIYTSAEDIDNSPKNLLFDPLPGDLKYADLNFDAVIDNQDKKTDPYYLLPYKEGETLNEITTYIAPPIFKLKTADFVVFQCNDKWSKENPVEGFPAAGAEINIFEKTGTQYVLFKTLTTDKEGKSMLELDGMKTFYYQVKKEESTPFYKGFLIVGLYTSEDQFLGDNTAVLGGLRLGDLNGDGRIDNQDKVTSEYLPVKCETEDDGTFALVPTNSVFIAPETFRPAPDWNALLNEKLKQLEANFKLFNIMYRTEDAALSHESSRNAVDFNTSDLNKMASDIWDLSYKIIGNVLETSVLFESDACPAAVKEQWGKESAKVWLEYAFVYSKLQNYFGGVPIIKEANDYRTPRATEDELTEYIAFVLNENVILRGSDPIRDAGRALLARVYLNKGTKESYMKALQLSKEVMDSGRYAFLTNGSVFTSSDNREIIWGGFPDNAQYIAKGPFTHLIRYTEVLLVYAEASTNLDRLTDAIHVINMIYISKGMPPYFPNAGATQDEVREQVIKLWNQEMKLEGFKYSDLKRWKLLIQELGIYGARQMHQVLPIPRKALQVNPNLIQNPGY